LGLGTAVAAMTAPARVALPEPANQLAVGESGTCVRTTSGKVYCWGQGLGGQLADGEFHIAWSPIESPALADADQLVRGPAGGCARRGGQLVGGGNEQLVAGGDNSTSVPTPVSITCDREPAR